MPPKISLAIATYNGEAFLREQLESICNQTLLPFEVVISDDGSTDDTLKIIKEFEGRLNIRVIQHDSNKGVNKNFEVAIFSCKGDYVMPCDQDDIWMYGKIERSYEQMKEIELTHGKDVPVLISSECSLFHDDKPIIQKEGLFQGVMDDSLSFLFANNLHCQGCSMMMNKSLLAILPSFPERFNDFPYDVFISMITTMMGVRSHLIQSLMYYRIHENNVAARYEKERFSEVVKKRVRMITYSVFGIPYSRQVHFSELLIEYGIEIKEETIKEYTMAISKFWNSSVIERISIIYSIKDMPLSVRIKQAATTFLTSPLRLIVKPL